MSEKKETGERDYREIIRHFLSDEEADAAAPYGNGHINDTIVVRAADGAEKYILQAINTDVFPDPFALTENIIRLTSYLKEQIVREGGDPMRETLTPVAAGDGTYLYRDSRGKYWRMYVFISDAVCREQADCGLFYESGVAFGHFQYMLRDFPAEQLHEVIPGFHDTPGRYRAFDRAVAQGNPLRRQETKEEIAFFLKRRKEAGHLARALAVGELPLRVTHNDSKLNNVMLDKKTGKGLCVIDLDTVMPGSAVYDFGDSIRFGASTAAEDETDLDRVSCSMELFEAYTRGFLEGCAGSLTKREIELFPLGVWTMTLEQGLRFLTDYLENDVYYKTARPRHNLERARNQIRLLEDMEKKWDTMTRLVAQAGS